MYRKKTSNSRTLTKRSVNSTILMQYYNSTTFISATVNRASLNNAKLK